MYGRASTLPELSPLPHPAPPVEADDMVVYRLVPCWSCDVVDGAWEPQSCAFDNASPEDSADCDRDMSVVLQDTLTALERIPEDLPADTGWAGDQWGVAAVPVAYLRHEEDQTIWRTPEVDEPAHGDVCGTKNTKRRRRIRKQATWIVRPAVAPPAAP
jgi:hypothetical protein